MATTSDGALNRQEMERVKKCDLLWGGLLLVILAFMLVPVTHNLFVQLSQSHIYLMAFAKFSVLATMGELLAIRIINGAWKKPVGFLWRALVWGGLGVSIALVFNLYATGVADALKNGLLPSLGQDGVSHRVSFAFFTSVLMNCFFAPTFMAFHRFTDTYIDLGQGKLRSMVKIQLKEVVGEIDWNRFISFVVCKTIPFFWIPAHTLTFLLPPEYRILMAALLSIALGVILGFVKK